MKSAITDSPQGERDEAVRQPTFSFLDLRAQFSSIRDEAMAAVAQIMESQHFILGPEVQACEKEVADYVQRDQLNRHLQQSGIPTQIYYPSPLHMQPAFAHLG